MDGVDVCSDGNLLGVAGFVRFALFGVVITGSMTEVEEQHPITVSRTLKMSMLLQVEFDLFGELGRDVPHFSPILNGKNPSPLCLRPYDV